MAEKKPRKGGGSKLTRSETVTVRLDPRLRFACELAAAKDRRTLSSFMEWAVEMAIHQVNVVADFDGEHMVWQTAADVAKAVWDVDESDRFVKLAANYPELLSTREQVLWKLIREDESFWKGTARDHDGLPDFNFKLLRERWTELQEKITNAPSIQAGLSSWHED